MQGWVLAPRGVSPRSGAQGLEPLGRLGLSPSAVRADAGCFVSARQAVGDVPAQRRKARVQMGRSGQPTAAEMSVIGICVPSKSCCAISHRASSSSCWKSAPFAFNRRLSVAWWMSKRKAACSEGGGDGLGAMTDPVSTRAGGGRRVPHVDTFHQRFDLGFKAPAQHRIGAFHPLGKAGHGKDDSAE